MQKKWKRNSKQRTITILHIAKRQKVYFEESERSYFEGLAEDMAKPEPCQKPQELAQKQKIHEIVSSTANVLESVELLIEELLKTVAGLQSVPNK